LSVIVTSCLGLDQVTAFSKGKVVARAEVTRVAGPLDLSLRRRVVVSVLQFSVVSRVLDYGGQATKGAWGMSWRQKAKKGVEVCDKPGGVDKRTLIPGFPNKPALNP
jgi:hypothetical protein